MTGTRAALAYLLDVLPVSRRMRVLDVGANPLSDPPYLELLRAGGCDLTGFEPQDDAFARLQAASGPHETYHPHALGDGTRRTLHVTRKGGFTSLFAPDAAALGLTGLTVATRVVARHAVETSRLDDVPDMVPQDLLKIDVQGAELEIIENGARTLADAVAIIPEMRFGRIYEGEPMFGDLDVALRGAGFCFLKFMFTKRRHFASSQIHRVRRRWSQSQMLDGDGVYIRDMTRSDAMSADQLSYLALAADAVFDSPDLTLLCLDRLAERGAVAADAAAGYMDILLDQTTPQVEALP